MARAQDGDQMAYRQLLHQITGYLRSLVAKHHRNPADVEDTVQDILLTVHAIRHTYDPSRPLARGWLPSHIAGSSIGCAARVACADSKGRSNQSMKPLPLAKRTSLRSQVMIALCDTRSRACRKASAGR